jgi:hypothetical protein
MIGLGVLLLILGVVIALLFAFVHPLGTYRNYGWGLGFLLIVVGVVLIVIGYLTPALAL